MLASEAGFEIVVPCVESSGRHPLAISYHASLRSLRSRVWSAVEGLGALGAAAIMLSLIVGAALARRVARPLDDLTARVQGVAQGQFDQQVEVPRGAEVEIVILASAFNSLTRDLRQYVESLAESYKSLETLNEELEARNTELERFTYTVSHDLKSPLITIRAYADFIRKDAGSGRLERLERDAGRIVDATTKMRNLLDDLLELSRVGRVVSPPEDIPFGVLVREAVELVRGQLDAHGVELWIDPELPVVKVDRARMVEVLQNLLDNAIKFMGKQERPRIEVTRRPGPDGAFLVRDNGAGIDPRHHQRVFGLFDKLDPESGGTGIGLALVKRIVEHHGGRIWVESEGAGQGTTFCLTLPRP